MPSTQKNRIFSAMQPTGSLHIGNYLGALKNWVDLQNSGGYNCIFGIVDYHAMTIDYDPRDMPKHITDLAIDYLSAGLDPDKSTIMVQSHVPEHTELAWIFNCITPMPELERMTQYKDKSRSNKTNPNVGLFSYPVLMAADILLYKADTVPVGEDQTQHVEFSRIIARKFNNRFAKIFPEPRTLLTKSARLSSLADPAKKMSKSLGEKHYIALTDTPAEIKKKISSAVTDTGPSKRVELSSTSEDPERGAKRRVEGKMSRGTKNLFDMLEVVSPLGTHKELMDEYKKGTLKYSDLKSTLADAIINHLKPIQEKRKELEHDHDKIAQILIQGAEHCQKIADKTMEEVRNKVGIR
ncbi:tryptophan--tRNA ligase [Candidatus Falkowbacteria bacterium]|nr:tryptophan--tRNA ligase [Candidatus Falkowbacteria bacterium]